ncbi:MAG: tetratricopeptide repeat protein [Ruminiclostridium sp.]|nr:tetratricopeptide repeat protein [Ruminiclostridium sp.]
MKKKTKLIFILNIIVIVISGIIIIWQFFFVKEKDMDILSKALVLFTVYLLAVTGIRKKRSINTVVYEEQYKEFLGEAFNTDKFSYRRLMKAIVLYNENKQQRAVDILDSITKNCLYPDDFAAVLLFKALCLEELDKLNEAEECYKDVIAYNKSHATAWSNLGYVYSRLGRTEDSFNAYSESLKYNPDNAFAHNNLAAYYVRKGEAEAALEKALEAIKLDPKMYQAMGAAAMAYKMLGDAENAEKYRRMYGANGGDAANLKNILEKI